MEVKMNVDYTKDKIRLFNCDCMAFMADIPNNYYELAIVDPPYGIGFAGFDKHYGGGKAVAKTTIHKPFAGGDKSSPDVDYFVELMRVSKNQIIWGANHFISKMPYDSPSWVVWNKINGKNPFADCELGWSSFKTAVRMFSFKWQGMLQGDMKEKERRIHPTQKPVALYRWLLTNYAKPNDKILDTHGGSGSIAIACDMEGFDLDICEIDKDYFNASVKRYNTYKSQLKLF
jgi:site-specific DNA-methyltransferase (adenine-specific)